MKLVYPSQQDLLISPSIPIEWVVSNISISRPIIILPQYCNHTLKSFSMAALYSHDGIESFAATLNSLGLCIPKEPDMSQC